MNDTELNRHLAILGVVLAAVMLPPTAAAIVLAYVLGLLTAKARSDPP